MKKGINYFGLGLFLMGFGWFNAAFFLEKYTLVAEEVEVILGMNQGPDGRPDQQLLGVDSEVHPDLKTQQKLGVGPDVHPDQQELGVDSEVHPDLKTHQELEVSSEVHPDQQELGVGSDVHPDLKTQGGVLSKEQLLLNELDTLLEVTLNSQFDLIEKLDNAFEKVNQQILATYSITDTELKSILEKNDATFSIATVDETLIGDDEVAVFKRKSFRDYGGWLDGQSISDRDDFLQTLQNVAEKIKLYGVINTYGYDRYKVKNLKYELTKSASQGLVSAFPLLFLLLTFGGSILGGLLYLLPGYNQIPPGIRNDNIFKRSLYSRGWLGILVGSWLIVFYVFLYFYHEYMTAWIIMTDPISYFLKGTPGGQFFLYGVMYTLVILVMGVRMIIKYRHSNYQIVRTLSVMFFQTAFAFIIPEILMRLNQPYYDFKNIWPLDYDFFFDNELNTLMQSGGIGVFMLVWGLVLMIIGVPVLVYFFGKRWYCSWVCGCGGLAETLGDPFRQLSNKSLKAWKIERIMIHSVLVFAVVMTIGVLYTYFTGSGTLLGMNTYNIREIYGAWIGAGFAGVIGTGFYPLMGNRVWCRFGCPLAAYLGIVQRFKSRFRITTNGGQCISCGNCSTYCEMGIDVRWYAQRQQDIVRASCVGCGVCSQVCPRGVLKLENQ